MLFFQDFHSGWATSWYNFDFVINLGWHFLWEEKKEKPLKGTESKSVLIFNWMIGEVSSCLSFSEAKQNIKSKTWNLHPGFIMKFSFIHLFFNVVSSIIITSMFQLCCSNVRLHWSIDSSPVRSCQIKNRKVTFCTNQGNHPHMDLRRCTETPYRQ